jgi:hypothetical protein
MSRETLEGQIIPMAAGTRYGRLVVGKQAGFKVYYDSDGNRHRIAMFDVVCDCGEKRTVQGRSLRSGNTTSCGCKCTEAVARGFQKFLAAGGVVPHDPATGKFIAEVA